MARCSRRSRAQILPTFPTSWYDLALGAFGLRRGTRRCWAGGNFDEPFRRSWDSTVSCSRGWTGNGSMPPARPHPPASGECSPWSVRWAVCPAISRCPICCRASVPRTPSTCSRPSAWLVRATASHEGISADSGGRSRKVSGVGGDGPRPRRHEQVPRLPLGKPDAIHRERPWSGPKANHSRCLPERRGSLAVQRAVNASTTSSRRPSAWSAANRAFAGFGAINHISARLPSCGVHRTRKSGRLGPPPAAAPPSQCSNVRARSTPPTRSIAYTPAPA